MKPRLRLLAALLALFALSASLAETAWASACMSMTPPVGAAGAPCEEMDGCGHAADDPAPADHERHPQPHGGDAPCPAAAFAASGCAAVFLPPAATAAPADLAEPAGRVPHPADRAPSLLLALSLFRPPRA